MIMAGAEKRRLIPATKSVTQELLKLFASECLVDGVISGSMRDDAWRGSNLSLQGLGLKVQIPLTRGFLFPVLADPSLPTLSGRGIPAGEG